MSFSPWHRWFGRKSPVVQWRACKRSRVAHFRPGVEALEQRLAPAVHLVTSTSDNFGVSSGTLRQAIIDANADPLTTPNMIQFNIAASGIQTINVGSTGNGALPAITKGVLIDGYSEGGASVNTLANGDNATILIELNGAAAGANADGLVVNIAEASASNHTTIQGLAINRFSANGIHLLSGFNSVTGNFVGTDPQGTVAEPNAIDGIRIESSNHNTIGGTTPEARNVASGNTIDGIHVVGTLVAPATNNLIEGNFAGVNAAGTGSVGNRPGAPAPGTAQGNGFFGIEISGGNSNTVGGTTAGARNVVGLNGAGIEVDDGGQGNIIQGNFSGVGADGVTPVGNLLHGIVLRSDGNLTAPLGPGQPNEPGVQNNLIGGTATGAGNLVGFNGTGGIAVFGNPVSLSGQANTGNAILGNNIFENGRSNPTFLLGIDLTNQFTFPRDDGITPNDPMDADAGPTIPNSFQNFPVLTSATMFPGSPKPPFPGATTITGTLNSTPSTNGFRIEFFASNPDPANGIAEGQRFLDSTGVVSGFGFTTVNTDANGNASFTVTVPGVAPGQRVTATATDPNGNTSEFSAGLEVSPPPPSPPGPPPLPPPPFVSVAISPFGEVLEVVSPTGVLTQYSAFGVQVLGTGVRSASVAFASFGEVLEVVTLDGTLTQYSAFGVQVLGTGVLSASVAFGPFGQVLEVVTLNGTLTQYSAFGVQVLGTGVLCAGVAISPFGEVLEVVTPDGTLTQYSAFGVQVLGTGVRSASVAFSPTAGEVLDVIFQDGSLVQFDAAGKHVLGKLF